MVDLSVDIGAVKLWKPGFSNKIWKRYWAWVCWKRSLICPFLSVARDLR